MARACSHFKEHGPCTLMLIPSHACTFSCVSQWSEKEMESVVPHMVPVRAPGTGENEHARAIQNVNIALVTPTSSARVDRTSRAFNRRFPISPHPRSSSAAATVGYLLACSTDSDPAKYVHVVHRRRPSCRVRSADGAARV